ncbi:Mitochondrial metalloendopeptidase OMA1 [Tetrabaena socialis]|uniref:Mitochondrial metalloendopeptidase OMA1 n=1 Tax=Tetrabaena socialis TaxID=47790 RepID=A0A2J7ZXJ3_9CHLO|nr:Mitochondrial metalloendopeptidase OMA1 [Tetrabaena socialis]|eukprot:PNH04993.1 Mitochondrial metalloendopeptidase OMA1 [Tetrabaena socialis]
MMKTVFLEFMPSISVSSWLSTRSAAPPASPAEEPRCTAMESSSSKKRTQGAEPRALSKISRTLASLSPNHMVSSSGPLIEMKRFLADQRAKGKLLSRRSREHLLVAEVANTIIAAAMRGLGGGSQGHMKRFKWEVVTVEDATPNAFVLPGGKVVVHTGLLRLLGGRRELLATVLGHEVAHAMARHSAEKVRARTTHATRDRPLEWPEPAAEDSAHHHHGTHPHKHTQPASPALAPVAAPPPAFLAVAGGPLWWALSYAVVPGLCGAVVGYALGLEALGVGAAAALGVVGRFAVRALAETVPFTGRRHNLLLPLPLELMMGEASFSFKWEVVTVEDATPNAFVLPGGKVVVHTGLLRLLGGRRELLATVLGHEVAHAMARHSAEKMTLGLLAALGLRLLAAAASRAATNNGDGAGADDARRRRQQQQQRQQEAGAYDSRRDVYGAARGGYDDTRAADGGWPLPGARRPAGGGAARGARPAAPPLFFGGGGEGGPSDPGGGEEDDYSVGPGSLVARLLEGAGASAQAAAREYARHAASGAAYARGGGGGPPRLDAAHPLMSGEVVGLLNSVLLQLPFSRRAESEADLIGLKLMALAGYDPTHAPETFKLLEGAERGRAGGALAAAAPRLAEAASLGCTHPRSANRVRALEEEGYDTVYTHPGYWSL